MSKRYILGPKIGEGAYGRVYKIIDTTTQLTYVAKFIEPISIHDIKSEITILKKISPKCNTNHLLCYVDSALYEDKESGIIKNLVLITDTISNSISLKQYISKTKPINFNNPDTEQLYDYFYIMYQLTIALSTLHNTYNIAHMDIKPNNVVINPKTMDLMIIDFGVSCDKSNCITSGTPGYFSPELIKHKDFHTIALSTAKESDVFSLGIIFYQLCVQFLHREYSPFTDSTTHSGFKSNSLIEAKIQEIHKELDFFSDKTKNSQVKKTLKLIKTMLDKNYKKRPSIKTVLSKLKFFKLEYNKRLTINKRPIPKIKPTSKYDFQTLSDDIQSEMNTDEAEEAFKQLMKVQSPIKKTAKNKETTTTTMVNNKKIL